MITYRSLKKTLTALLKNKFPDCKVHFDNVEKSDAPYFYVEMQPYTSTVDGEGVYHDRNIEIDIQYIPDEDLFGRIDRMKIYDIGQILDLAIRPVFMWKIEPSPFRKPKPLSMMKCCIIFSGYSSRTLT